MTAKFHLSLWILQIAILGLTVSCSKTQQMKGDVVAAPRDITSPPPDAQRLPDGLVTKVLRAGTGADHPTPDSTVTVQYSGWTTDGKMFDSSVSRNAPATFPLNQVIAGWTEGVGLMVVGEKRRLWIPQHLAYDGQSGAPAGTLIFDIELLEIK